MKLQGVVFDWAGTLADHGSCGPVAALESVFARAGVAISRPEARQSMGIAKRAHVAAILRIPRVAAEWTRLRGQEPGEDAVRELYEHFVPEQLSVLGAHATLIPGAAAAAERIRRKGWKIGTTTGYTRPMLDFLLARAHGQGFQPDAAMCPADVPEGRPAPWMCHLAAMRMNTYPAGTLVKIGDTPSDMEEGRNAGMWTIGITRTGNEVGLSEDEWDAAPASLREALLAHAAERLKQAGADYLAGSVAECDGIFAAIDLAIQRGEAPGR